MDLIVNTPTNSSILDLSQRPTTVNPIIILDNWTKLDSLCNYTDRIDDDIRRIESDKTYNIEQSLTDQFQDLPIKEDSMSDSSNINKSKLDLYHSTKPTKK
jgi:hypothetical protein